MKAFILTEGGIQEGFGHITRCVSLYQAFEERGIVPNLFISGDDSVAPIVKDKNYHIFDWRENQQELFRKITGVTIVVIDSYKADLHFYQKVSEIAKVPIYFDDTLRLDYPRGIVVNGAVDAEKLPYPQKPGVHYLLGSRFFPLRRELWDVPDKEIKEKIEAVLVTFGGSDERNLTPLVLGYLTEYNPELTKIVIVGNGFINVEEIRKAADAKTRLIIHPDGHALKSAMLEADVAISAAGQTLIELARVGVPTIAVGVAENQWAHIQGGIRAEIIAFAGWWKERHFLGKVGNQLERLKDMNKRKKMSDAGRSTITGEGPENLVTLIYKMISE